MPKKAKKKKQEAPVQDKVETHVAKTSHKNGFEDWNMIGDDLKKLRKAYFDISERLSSKLPKEYYNGQLASIDKSIDQLRYVLEEIMINENPSANHMAVLNAFYGE